MGITTKTNFDNSSAAYRSLFQNVFLGQEEANWQLYSHTDSAQGTSYEYTFMSDMPDSREWVGKKEYKATRANKLNIPTKPYESSTSVPVVDFDQNPEGVGRNIRDWLSASRGFINNLVVKKFLLGDVDTGHDGLSLFNTAHAGPLGSTQSNRVTTALSQAAYRTGKAAMRAFKDNSGRPLGLRPKLFIVGPAKEDVARDIIEAKDRVVAVDNSGAESGTRVAASSIENVVSADGVRLIVEPRLAGGTNSAGTDSSNFWFLVDTDLPPMVVNMAKAPSPSDDTDEHLPGAAEYHFSIEAQLSIGYGPWQGVYASLATS